MCFFNGIPPILSGEFKLENGREKRKYPRVEINWPVTIYVDDEIIEGETNNISAEGVSVRSETPLPVNKVFSILIRPPDHQAIDLKGQVVWSDMYGVTGAEETEVYGLGICLVELSEEDKKAIKAMLSNSL